MPLASRGQPVCPCRTGAALDEVGCVGLGGARGAPERPPGETLKMKAIARTLYVTKSGTDS